MQMYFEARSANTKLLYEKKQLEKTRDDLQFQWESHWPSCLLLATRVSERQRFLQTTVDSVRSFPPPRNSPTSVTTSESSNFIPTTRTVIRTDSMSPSVDEADCVPNSHGSEIVSPSIEEISFLSDMEHPESKFSDRSDSQNFFESHKTDDLLPMIDSLEMLPCLAADSGCNPQTELPPSVDVDDMDYATDAGFQTTADTMSPGSLSGISTDRRTGYGQTLESMLDDESISFDCSQLSSPQSALTSRTDLTYSAMGSDFIGDIIPVDEVTSGEATETSLPGFFTATVALPDMAGRGKNLSEASDQSILQFSTLNKDDGDCSDNDSLIPIHVQNIICDS